MDKVKSVLTIILKGLSSVFIIVSVAIGAVLFCVGFLLMELAITLEEKGWVLYFKKKT